MRIKVPANASWQALNANGRMSPSNAFIYEEREKNLPSGVNIFFFPAFNEM